MVKPHPPSKTSHSLYPPTDAWGYSTNSPSGPPDPGRRVREAHIEAGLCPAREGLVAGRRIGAPERGIGGRRWGRTYFFNPFILLL